MGDKKGDPEMKIEKTYTWRHQKIMVDTHIKSSWKYLTKHESLNTNFKEEHIFPNDWKKK